MTDYRKYDHDGNPIPDSFDNAKWNAEYERSRRTRNKGCGCGSRALRFVEWLGVDMDPVYVRNHHVRASLRAIVLFMRSGGPLGFMR